MKIAIDARWIFQELSGIGAYTRELMRQLLKIDKENDYLFIFQDSSLLDRTLKEVDITANAQFKTLLVPYGLFSIKNQLLMPGLLKKMKVDLYHSPNYMIPLAAFPADRIGRIKCVTTLHDVIPMIFPDHAPKSRKSRYFKFYLRLMIEVAKRSDTIITVSKASAADIIKHLKIPAGRSQKVKCIYNGVSDMFQPPENPGYYKESQEEQILYVGRSDPYKNVSTLIRAFEKIQSQNTSPVRLVIAGSIDPRYPEAKQLAEYLKISDCVHWTGYISDEELVALYQNSSLLIHPSRYEGFGLQIIEAMSCGLPVICTNKGSQPEVAGDAAIVLDPDDEAGMVDNTLKILRDRSVREEMRKKGYTQAAKFSWEKTAEQTLKVYKKTCDTTGELKLGMLDPGGLLR